MKLYEILVFYLQFNPWIIVNCRKYFLDPSNLTSIHQRPAVGPVRWQSNMTHGSSEVETNMVRGLLLSKHPKRYFSLPNGLRPLGGGFRLTLLSLDSPQKSISNRSGRKKNYKIFAVFDLLPNKRPQSTQKSLKWVRNYL